MPAAAAYDAARSPFALRDIEKLIPPGSAVLDAGCGTGQHARALSAVAGHVTGVDTDASRVALASRGAPSNTRFLTASLLALPFPAGSFDVVLVSQVLHHLCAAPPKASQVEWHAAVTRALAEICRVMRAGGRLLLVTTSLEQRSNAYWHFPLFPATVYARMHDVWTLTEGAHWHRCTALAGLSPVLSTTPDESHWVETADARKVVADGLDAEWRSTDVAFDLLSDAELAAFIAKVRDIVEQGREEEVVAQARAMRRKYGEATLHVFEKRAEAD